MSDDKLKYNMFPKILNKENLLIHPGKKQKHKLSMVYINIYGNFLLIKVSAFIT